MQSHGQRQLHHCKPEPLGSAFRGLGVVWQSENTLHDELAEGVKLSQGRQALRRRGDLGEEEESGVDAYEQEAQSMLRVELWQGQHLELDSLNFGLHKLKDKLLRPQGSTSKAYATPLN